MPQCWQLNSLPELVFVHDLEINDKKQQENLMDE